MQPHEQAQFLRAVGLFVRDEIDKATAPLITRIAELEKLRSFVDNSITAVVEDSGQRCDILVEQCAQMIRDAINKLPTPKDGEPGKDGAPAVIDQEMLKQYLDDLFDNWPKPKDGEDGQDGRDGVDGKSVALDDLVAIIESRVTESVARIPVPRHIVGGFIDLAGDLHFTYNDGVSIRLGKVVGKDCDMVAVAEQVAGEIQKIVATWPRPKDGVDGLGFDDLRVEQVDERTLKFVFQNGDRFKEFNIMLSHMLDKGVWRAGSFVKGDSVSLGGSMFIAQRDTDKKPGESEDWRLAVKRGQDGKDGARGPKGDTGRTGPAGLDLRGM